MNSKDNAFLDKFHAKESSNLINLENFGPQAIWAVWGGTPPPTIPPPLISQKMTKSPPIRVPTPKHTKFLHPSRKCLIPSCCYLK